MLPLLLLVLSSAAAAAFLVPAAAHAETVSVDLEGGSFDVDYAATGVTLSGIRLDLAFSSMLIPVEVTDPVSGTLEITIDRALLDSLSGADDADFTVLADDDLAAYSEIETTPESRTLRIGLPAGTQDLEIIGSVIGGVRTAEAPTPAPEPAPEPEPEPAPTPAPEPEPSGDGLPAQPEAPSTAMPGPAPSADPQPPAAGSEPAPPEAAPPPPPSDTACGPGTVLMDGVCMLDERCGPGTMLQDGVCVLAPQSQSQSPLSAREMGKEWIAGIVGGFAIAGAVALFLKLVTHADKSIYYPGSPRPMGVEQGRD